MTTKIEKDHEHRHPMHLLVRGDGVNGDDAYCSGCGELLECRHRNADGSWYWPELAPDYRSDYGLRLALNSGSQDV